MAQPSVSRRRQPKAGVIPRTLGNLRFDPVRLHPPLFQSGGGSHSEDTCGGSETLVSDGPRSVACLFEIAPRTLGWAIDPGLRKNSWEQTGYRRLPYKPGAPT